MKNYLTGLLHIAFRAPYIYVALFIAILSFTLPLVVDSYVFGPGMLDEEMRINRMILQTNIDGGAYDKAPDEVVQSARKDLELINGFFDNGETNKRFGFASRYYGRAVLQIERGALSGDLDVARGKELYCGALTQLEEYTSFSSTRSMPALIYLSFSLGSMPTPLLFAPVLIVIAGVAWATRCGTVLHRSPVGYMQKIIAQALVCLIQIAVVFLGSVLIPLIAIAAVNGIGDPSFPVVYTQSGALHITDLGSCTVHLLLLYTACAVFLSSLALAITGASGYARPGLLVDGLLVIVPLFPWYLMGSEISDMLYRFLPTTYLPIGRVCGYVGVFPHADMAPAAHLDSVFGIFYLLFCAALLFGAACVTHKVAGTGILMKRQVV